MVQDMVITLSPHWWGRLHEKEHEIWMTTIGKCWSMKKVTKWEWSIPRTAMDFFFLFTSCSRTLWWYSNKSRIDELHVYSFQLDGAHLPQITFVGFSVYSGEWKNSGRKREWPGPTIRSFVQLWIPSGKDPEEEPRNFDHGVPQKQNNETQWTRNQNVLLFRIFKSTGSKNVSGRQNHLQSSPTQQCKGTVWLEWFLRTEIEYFCNHHLHNSARGLHGSNDFSEQRSSTFRTTRNTKATTQGHLEELLANTVAAATAAAAAAETRGWHSVPLETACYLGKPSKNASRYETSHRRESNQATGATHFCSDRCYSSKESRQAIFNMDNVELIELKKTTIQCPSCLHFVFEGTFRY